MKESIFREPLQNALKRLDRGDYSVSDIKTLLLARDHLMLNCGLNELKEIDWLGIVAKLTEDYNNRNLLLRLLQFLDQNCFLDCQTHVPLLLLNSIAKVETRMNSFFKEIYRTLTHWIWTEKFLLSN